ncbi:MAG TPA: hypothetical protein VN622_12620 [Clostridia bacterium]|nr:hypothetical protein [Clostridia bacterium]
MPAETLKRTNALLVGFLESMEAAPASSVTLEQLTEVASALAEMAGALGYYLLARDPVVAAEIQRYRGNLSALQAALHQAERNFLAERARLSRDRQQLEAAAAWNAGPCRR